FMKSCFGIVPETAVLFSEISEAETVQMALVGRVAKGTEVSIVGSFDAHRTAGPHQAVKLLHGANYIFNVLDDMYRSEAIEGAIGERIRKTVEVGQNIGAAGGIPVDSDGTGLLVNPAADVENSHPFSIASFRHCSSVSTAKSH